MQASSEVAYFDTNILSHLAQNRQLWSKLGVFLAENNLVLGISSAHVAELADVTRQHQALAELFVSIPSGILKTWDVILAEEIQAHPQKRSQSLFAHLFTPTEPDNLQRIQAFLSSKNLRYARQDQLNYAQQMTGRHDQLKSNFPPHRTGKYTIEQAEQFAWMQVIQWLGQIHRDFLVRFQNNIQDFHTNVFLSIRLFAQVIFYKYYIGQREPKKISDFGDLAHIFPIPYCNMLITERDLCNILNQIKRNHDTLSSTVIHNIDFFGNWKPT